MVFFNRHTHGAFGIRLNEILIIWPSEKNHKTSLSGGISTRKSNFSIIKKNKLLNIFLSPYAICIIKFSIRPILRQKNFAENWEGALIHNSCRRCIYYSGRRCNRGWRPNRGITRIDLENSISRILHEIKVWLLSLILYYHRYHNL